jgi:hypothetical protein
MRPSRRRMSRSMTCRSRSAESFPATRYLCSGSLGSRSTRRPRHRASAFNFYASSCNWRCRWPMTSAASA